MSPTVKVRRMPTVNQDPQRSRASRARTLEIRRARELRGKS